MRRAGKWFFTALGSLAVLLAIGITSTIGWSPFLGPKARALTNRTFARTQQRLERGRYIATGKKDGTLNSLPTNHNPRFAPVIHPTLETGVKALVVAAHAWLAS